MASTKENLEPIMVATSATFFLYMDGILIHLRTVGENHEKSYFGCE